MTHSIAARRKATGLAPVLFLTLAGLAVDGLALVLPDEVAERVDASIQAHVGSDGFRPVETDQLIDADWYSVKRFPNQNPGALRWPDADLDAVTRAILLLESQEPALESFRYRLRLHLAAASPEYAEVRYNQIELIRYNLGAAWHAANVESYGADVAAEPGADTRLPHVAWRFVMNTTQGLSADLVAASRREVAEHEAARHECLGEPCLGLDSEIASGLDYEERPATDAAPAAPFVERMASEPGDGLATAARVAQELFADATRHGQELSESARPDRPEIELVIAFNDGGQELNSKAVLRQSQLMDDDLAEIWTSRVELPGYSQWQQRYVRRR